MYDHILALITVKKADLRPEEGAFYRKLHEGVKELRDMACRSECATKQSLLGRILQISCNSRKWRPIP